MDQSAQNTFERTLDRRAVYFGDGFIWFAMITDLLVVNDDSILRSAQNAARIPFRFGCVVEGCAFPDHAAQGMPALSSRSRRGN